MKDDHTPEERMLLAALGGGKDCPAVEQLEPLLDPNTGAVSPISRHVASCPRCQTELELMRQFQAGAVRESEAEAIRLIIERLQTRSKEIFRASKSQAEVRKTWWQALWNPPRFGQAALVLSGVVLAAVLSLQLRNRPPALRPSTPDQEVLRSNAISVIAPIGDIAQPPNEVRWQAVPNASKYEVQLLEVDGAELWKAETMRDRIEFPSPVRARIVPAKTLMCRVSAFDSSGHRIAESEAVRFRLLPYKP